MNDVCDCFIVDLNRMKINKKKNFFWRVAAAAVAVVGYFIERSFFLFLIYETIETVDVTFF